MRLTLATFNIENLVRRFEHERDGRTGRWLPDPAVGLHDVRDEREGLMLERALAVAIADDQRQMTAQAIRDLDADVLCLQEVDDLATLRWFHDRYVRRAVREPYEHFAVMEGNDRRGIDVGVVARRGFPVRVRSWAHVTVRDMELPPEEMKRHGLKPDDLVFKRDCLEVDVECGASTLTLFVCHFKSMNEGREQTMPIRRLEARAVRRIVEERFGKGAGAAEAVWAIVGDLNDYRAKLVLDEGPTSWRRVEPHGLDPLFADHFAVDVMERLRPSERWTHYWAEGREFSQLDYLLLSPALARANPEARPRVVREGLPWRVPMDVPGFTAAPVTRYPRVGFDRPKASDHCGVAVTLEI